MGKKDGGSDDFNEMRNFKNQIHITDNVHDSVKYNSLNANSQITIEVHEATEFSHNFKGRRMGKTRFYRQYKNFSTGEVFVKMPSNHVSKFSYPFKEKMYDGAQNVDPGFLDTQYEDYSTSSFYRVKVTGGENQIIVKGNSTPEIDSNDNIIY